MSSNQVGFPSPYPTINLLEVHAGYSIWLLRKCGVQLAPPPPPLLIQVHLHRRETYFRLCETCLAKIYERKATEKIQVMNI